MTDAKNKVVGSYRLTVHFQWDGSNTLKLHKTCFTRADRSKVQPSSIRIPDGRGTQSLSYFLLKIAAEETAVSGRAIEAFHDVVRRSHPVRPWVELIFGGESLTTLFQPKTAKSGPYLMLETDAWSKDDIEVYCDDCKISDPSGLEILADAFGQRLDKPAGGDRASKMAACREKWTEHVQRSAGNVNRTIATGHAKPIRDDLSDTDLATLNELLEQSVLASRDGRITESLRFARRAKDVCWPDPLVFKQMGSALLRYRALGPFENYLSEMKGDGRPAMYTDDVRRIEADYYRRKKEPARAMGILQTIENPNGYNIHYMKGMCQLLSFRQSTLGGDPQESYLMSARRHFNMAMALQPNHWWITVNVVLMNKLRPVPGPTLVQTAHAQLRSAIHARRRKASPRLYRLFLTAIETDGDIAKVRQLVGEDHAECQETPLEVAGDFVDTICWRLRLAFADRPQITREFEDQLHHWVSGFEFLDEPVT